MRSYRVHACSPVPNHRIPYLVISLVGAQRVSLDLGRMVHEPATGEFTVTLTMEALYDLLQGKPISIQRTEGNVELSAEHEQLVIRRSSNKSCYRVWLSEVALAWNMLAGGAGATAKLNWGTA